MVVSTGGFGRALGFPKITWLSVGWGSGMQGQSVFLRSGALVLVVQYPCICIVGKCARDWAKAHVKKIADVILSGTLNDVLIVVVLRFLDSGKSTRLPQSVAQRGRLLSRRVSERTS